MAFKDLTARERITAVHADFMREPTFVRLGGVVMIGQVQMHDTPIICPTAMTDGEHVHYNTDFVMAMTRKQLRYLVAHENLHKALHHCVLYCDVKEKYPNEYAQAIDYVVNGNIEAMDPGFAFVDRPTAVTPLVDPEYSDLSVLEVVGRLLRKNNGKPQSQKPQLMDIHVHVVASIEGGDGDGDGGADGEATKSAAALKKLAQDIQDAVIQGTLVSERMRSNAGISGDINGYTERQTDWRGPMRQFLQEIGEGDEQSRFSPPNKRLFPLGIILPSHFNEEVGEFIVACDTSGSMGGVYPVVFGEIANIARTLNPKQVRVIWWDHKVQSEQVFTKNEYDKMQDVMRPRGGGGTTVSCVAEYVKEKRYKPQATIMLTDGYIEASYKVVDGPVLWGVVDNKQFVPRRGKRVDISSVST